MLSYPRFDLADSSYGIMLMADQTPAWREVYTRIMDELATRHTTYWAAIDWNTFMGHLMHLVIRYGRNVCAEITTRRV